MAVGRFLHSSSSSYSRGGAGFLFPSLALPGLSHFLSGGQGSPHSTYEHLCVVIMYRGPGWPGMGVLALSVLLHSNLFKGTCTEIGNVPHLPPTFILLSFLTHLALYSQASALSHQDSSSSCSLPTLKPLSKGSSLELQGVESNVYILFCLISHPERRFEEPEKEPAVVPGPVSRLVI